MLGENMRLLRWALLLPAALCAWYAMFFIGLSAHTFVERHFCPPPELVSGFCTNASLQQALELVMLLSVAISALAVELAATAMAPSHKEITVWTTLAAGIVTAGFIAFSAQAWSLFLAAAAGGTLGAVAIVIFLRARGRRRNSF